MKKAADAAAPRLALQDTVVKHTPESVSSCKRGGPNGRRSMRTIVQVLACVLSAPSISLVSHSYVTAPTLFAVIVPSGAITNVSGTP